MRGRLALVFELRGAQFERKRCVRCSTIGTVIGAAVTELAAPLSAISALRRRNVFAVDTNWRRSTSRGDDGGREGGAVLAGNVAELRAQRAHRPSEYIVSHLAVMGTALRA